MGTLRKKIASRKLLFATLGGMFLVSLTLFNNCGGNFKPSSTALRSITSTASSLPGGTDTGGGGGGGVGGSADFPAIPSAFSAGSLRVCDSGCPYSLPSEAMAAAVDGSVIEIEAGEYNDCVTVSKNNVTIRGVKGYAHMRDKVCGNGGIIWISGAVPPVGTVVENMMFSGAVHRDHNGSGIRAQGRGLTVRNCIFKDSESGILQGHGAVSGDDITIEYSVFYNNGSYGHIGNEHNTYISGGVENLNYRFNVSLAATGQGHELKSRAQNTHVDCSVLADIDSDASYTLDVPQSGNLTVKRSFIQQGPNSSNYNGIISYGREFVVQNPGNNVHFEDTLIVNDNSATGFGFWLQVADAANFKFINTSLVKIGVVFRDASSNLDAADVGLAALPPVHANRAAAEASAGRPLGGINFIPELPDSCKKIYPPRCKSLNAYVEEFTKGIDCN